MKKGLRKLSSMVLAVFLVITMVSSSFAESSITITETSEGAYNANSEFKFYRILNAKTKDNTNYSYSIETDENHKKYWKAFDNIMTDKTDPSIMDIYNYVIGLDPTKHSNDKAKLIAFQKAMYDQITALSITPDKTGGAGKHVLPSGYYLIVETAKSTDKKEDVISFRMLSLVGNQNVDVQVKQALPTLKKQVKEVNESTGASSWGVVADADQYNNAAGDFRDTIHFRLTATIPKGFDSYEKYTMEFHDTLDTGLTLDQNSIELYLIDATSAENTDNTGTKINLDTNVTIPTKGNQNFTLSIANIKDIPGIKSSEPAAGGKKLQVRYTAKLNDDAKMGLQTTDPNPEPDKGNQNTAQLKYSSDPYATGGGNLSETPEQKVTVYTYQLNVKKLDGSGSKPPLNGATFSLYKKMNGTDNKLVQTIVGTNQSTFQFKGLDAGTYVLKEDEPPTGFNAMDDIEFKIESGFTGQTLTSLSVKKKKANPPTEFEDTEWGAQETEGGATDKVLGIYAVKIENNKGAKLPETGGRGTTLIYLLGAVFTFAAGVILISRRRMNINK